MALTQTIALLGLVLKDDNLLALAVFHHGGVHGSAFHHGGAELGRVAQDGQDLVKLDGVTGFLGQLLDEQNVAFRDLILLSGAKRGGKRSVPPTPAYDPFKAALKL